MSKKMLIVIALLLLFVFVFAACQKTEYPFDALKDGPAENDAIRSNGGVYVEKGEWSYFVNGVDSNINHNEWGREHLGSLFRVKTSQLGKEDANIEVVVPKIIYTNELGSFGFRIYGNNIYYSTPNSEKNAGGNVQYNKTDIMSAKLDGTSTKKLYTLEDNTIPFFAGEVANKPYIFWLAGSELHCYDVGAAQDVVITDEIKDHKFDRDNARIFYTITPNYKNSADQDVDYKYNELYCFVPGSEAVLLKTGKNVDESVNQKGTNHNTITMVYVDNDFVWYTQKNNFSGEVNERKIKISNPTIDTIVSLAPNTNYIAYENGSSNILIVLDSTTLRLRSYDSNGNIEESKCVNLAYDVVSDGFKFEYLSTNKGSLYYSASGLLYTIEIGTEAKKPTVVIKGESGNSWIAFDFVERDGTVYVINNNSNDADYYLYFYVTHYDVANKEYKHNLISKIIDDEE